MCADAPDTSGMNQAAIDNAQVAKEALDWAKQTYAEQADERAATAARANALSDAQLDATTFATNQAKELDAYNKSTFRPIEAGLAAEAQTYDTTARRADAAQSAAATVDSSFDATRSAMSRALARQGVTPGSAKAMALMQDNATAQAAARAGAATGAARNVETQGYARRMDAAALGRGVVSNQATQQQIANTTGNSSVANAGAALGASMAGNSLMQQGFSQATQANSSAGSLYGQAASLQTQADAANMQGIAALASTGAMLYKSDRSVKTGTGHMASGVKALKEIKDTPVHEGWSYDPAKGGPDDGGAKHIGPMAQDVRRVSGESAAPGGKVVSVMDEIGRMRAAIQQLAKQQDKLMGVAA